MKIKIKHKRYRDLIVLEEKNMNTHIDERFYSIIISNELNTVLRKVRYNIDDITMIIEDYERR